MDDVRMNGLPEPPFRALRPTMVRTDDNPAIFNNN